MNFHLKSKPKRTFDTKYITAGIFFGFLLLLSFLFPNFLRTVGHSTMKPFWFLKEKTENSFRYVTTYLEFQSSLVKENEDLKSELASLRLDKIDYEFLLKENNELKRDLEGMPSNRVISNVLSKPPQSPFDTFVIDKGQNDGVSIGSNVYISNGIILGKVVSVTSKTSIFKMFSGGGEITEATVSRTGANFSLTGEGGSNFSLEVPSDTDIIWGDSFIHSSSQSVLATVIFVDSNSQSSFKKIHLKTPINFLQIKRVFVEKQ